MQLTPTLWRTCRVLSGSTRLELLRLILKTPDQCVTELMEAVGLSESRISQELRRLQSRGLVKAVRSGRWVRYRPVPDPKVFSAKPILLAMKAALADSSPKADKETIRVAKAFSNAKRLNLVSELLKDPLSIAALQSAVGISPQSLFRHLRRLKDAGVIQRRGKAWEMAPNSHPLVQCILGMLVLK